GGVAQQPDGTRPQGRHARPRAPTEAPRGPRRSEAHSHRPQGGLPPREVRRIVPLLGLLAAGVGRAPAQASSDTTVTAEGFVERTDSGGWEIMLPQPLTVAGRQVNLLTARGKVGPYSRLQDRYVRAVGRVRLGPREP